ncbi:MAG: hypothetical protein AMXMBFR4_22570 [Candidatus Hydrogenedentota bacterium]
MTQAVTFDAAGTLLRVEPSVGHVYAETASRYGVNVSPERLNEVFTAQWRRLRAAHAGSTPFHASEALEREWWNRLVTAVFASAQSLDAFDGQFPQFFDELYARFERPEVWHPFDDVLPTFEALHARGVACAIVSNWDSRLPRLLDAMGWGRWVLFVLTSAEAGVGKPARAIFDLAVARLRCPSGDVLHVGDSIEDDARAASRAGLRGVLLDRAGTCVDYAPSVASLTELLELL